MKEKRRSVGVNIVDMEREPKMGQSCPDPYYLLEMSLQAIAMGTKSADLYHQSASALQSIFEEEGITPAERASKLLRLLDKGVWNSE
ncbi:MAG: hypothetical protein HY719_10435 [Planctomycetes bacterium]|nr:hypothetical protein [Planctomycetota bacterium]